MQIVYGVTTHKICKLVLDLVGSIILDSQCVLSGIIINPDVAIKSVPTIISTVIN